jgi:hypothetical protein
LAAAETGSVFVAKMTPAEKAIRESSENPATKTTTPQHGVVEFELAENNRPRPSISTKAIQVAKPGIHGKRRQASPVADPANCTARAAKPTTHFFIRYQLSSIRTSGFAAGLSDDFSPFAQTLLTKAPSLAPPRERPSVKRPSEIPTLFQYVKPTI